MFGDKKQQQQEDGLAPVATSDVGDVEDYANKPRADPNESDPFGELSQDGPNYKNVGVTCHMDTASADMVYRLAGQEALSSCSRLRSGWVSWVFQELSTC